MILKQIPADRIQTPSLQAYLHLVEEEIVDAERTSSTSPAGSCSFQEALALVRNVGKPLEDTGTAILFRLAANSGSTSFVEWFPSIMREISHLGEVGPKSRAAAIRHLPPSHEHFEKLLYARPMSEVVFCAAIASFSDGNDWKKAVQLLESMPDHNLVADVSCYNAALAAVVRVDEPEVCKTLLSNLKNDGLQSDNATCAVLRKTFRRPTQTAELEQNLQSGALAANYYKKWWAKCGWPDPNASLIDLHHIPPQVALSLACLVVSKLKKKFKK